MILLIFLVLGLLFFDPIFFSDWLPTVQKSLGQGYVILKANGTTAFNPGFNDKSVLWLT